MTFIRAVKFNAIVGTQLILVFLSLKQQEERQREGTVIYYCLFVFLNINTLERQYQSSNVYFISREHDVLLLGKCVLWRDLSWEVGRFYCKYFSSFPLFSCGIKFLS